MDEIYIPSNSNRSKEQKAPVTIERPPRVRRGLFSRIADFFSQRDPVELANDIWDNEIKVGGKQILSNSLHKIVDGIVYEAGEKRPRIVETNNSMIRYDKASARTIDSTVHERTPAQIKPHDVEFDTEEQAKEKLALMDEIMAVNGVLRVSEFFDICEYKCPHTYENWGWEDITMFRIAKKANGKWRFFNVPNAIRI